MKWNLRRFCRRYIALFATLLVTCAATSYLQAGIVSFSGVTPLGGPPAPGVHPGDQPPVPTPIVFPELPGLGIVPAGGLPVDHDGSVVVASPVETGSVVNPLLVPTVIPPGTLFESYLFHFDPLDTAFPSAGNFYPGSTITFSTKILGVQLFSTGFTALDKPAGTDYVGKLEAGDAVVAANGGPPAGYYPGGMVFRGLEEDAMAISGGGTTITLAGEADGVEIDQVRIIVAVPEPTSCMLASMGLLGLIFSGITRVVRARRS